MWRHILAACGILLTVHGTAAAAETGNCSAIADPAARLACYDRLNAPAATATPAEAEPAVEPVVSPAGVLETPAATAPAERFGAETLPAENGERKIPDAIESRITGRFKGWTKDTEFRLDNGQVWRCVNCRDVYHQIDNPAVTVKRGFMGNYWLKVEGLNTQASVKRVK